MDDIDRLMEHAGKLLFRVNFVLQNEDVDLVLGILGKLLALHLRTLPHEEREAELEDWLRLVRKLSGMLQ